MAKFTNLHLGARGINLKSGATVLVEPGKTVELDEKDIADVHPDITKGEAAAKRALGVVEESDGDDAELIAAVEAANADLTKQVADLTKERDEIKKAVDEAGKANADLTKANADLAAKLEAATRK